jgi:hypothetical protein
MLVQIGNPALAEDDMGGIVKIEVQHDCLSVAFGYYCAINPDFLRPKRLIGGNFVKRGINCILQWPVLKLSI